jgi:hypothetical protein
MKNSGDLLHTDFIKELLSRFSEVLTKLFKDLCKDLNLDHDVAVEISNAKFIEPDSDPMVCGYYDPSKRLIVASLPCAVEMRGRDFSGKLLGTLAHELVHHCQFTCRSQLCKNICSVWLTAEEAQEISRMLPYDKRPHEVEARCKEKELGEVIWNKIKEEQEARELLASLILFLS